MCKKLIYLVSIFLVLCLLGPVAAQDMEIGFAAQPPVIDGEVDDIWAGASTQTIVPQADPANASGRWMALYDSDNLYVIVDITDDSLVNDTDSSWQDDSVEFYFDGGNTKDGPPLAGDNRQYTFGWTTQDIQGTNTQTDGVEHAQVNTDTGWRIEIKLPWMSLQGAEPQAGDLIGIDCFYNDDDDGGTSREAQIWTFATDGSAWNDASQWGTAILADIPEPPVTITVEAGGDIAAANEMAKAGDTIEIAAGTYVLTSQIEIKDGVTYRGAGPGLTIIDGNDVTRAFAAFGDRSFNDGNENPNDSGPKGWVLEGMTIQNCVADTNNRFSYAGVAFDLLDVFADNDADASGGLSPEEADADAGAIRLPGADGTEGTEDDDLHRFAAMDADGNGELSEAELNDQLLSTEVEFANEDGDGGAITIHNESVGTIQNCDFLNNHTPIPGDGDDGGAINITGRSTITINDCLFNGNYACSPTSVAESDETGDADGDGGHIKVQGNNLTNGFINVGTTLIANRCVFLNGNAEDDGGAIQATAQGVVVRLDSCWFEGNTSWDNGNVLAFQNEDQHEATVTNCVFANNITNSDNSPDRMCEVRRNTKFINCTFVGNVQEDQDLIYNNANAADGDHDGVDDEMADVTQVVNCIFANNVVGNGDDVLGSRNNNFSIAATNCLFFNNTLQNGNAADNTQRPDVETGSILSDPLLDADLIPGAGSEAIDGGVDPAIVGVTLTNDYNGATRPKGAAYDIGAFEVGAENILANGGFEDGVVEPWSTYGNVTTEVVTELVGAAVPEAPIEGNSCLHIVVPEAGANFWDAGLQHAGHVFEAGKQYTLSAYLKSKSGTLDINFKPELGQDPWTGYGEQAFTMTEEWTEFSTTTAVFEADVSPATITFHIAYAPGDFWVDGVKFVEVE